MMPMLIAVFSASLVGSLHCAGMCGPFCIFAVTQGNSKCPVWLLHTAYHGGRLITYTVVGAIAGGTGALLDIASALAGIQPIAIGLAGTMMILFGVVEFLRQSNQHRWLSWLTHWRPPTRWKNLIHFGQRYAAKKEALPRAFIIGLLTTLLPCGWLYAFVVTAAGSGTPYLGALIMMFFWIGTLPVMLSIGLGVQHLTGVVGKRLPLLTATALILVGIATLASRYSLSSEAIASVVQSESIEGELPTSNELPPCCRERVGNNQP